MSPLSTKRARSLILLMILAGQLMIVLDASVITTALPTIERSLGFSAASLSWVQNAYTLTFGGLLLLGARMGDILGRRRVFVVGIAVFTLASLMGGLAQNAAWLLIARAVQGVAAAVAAPSTLALLQQTFQEPKERARAIALFSSVVGAGASFGLVVGGLLTDLLSWRWGLFINVPIGIVLVIAAPRLLPETERHTGKFDIVGAITSTGGMASLVYGFVRAASDGWSNVGTLVAFASGLILLIIFVFNELRVEQPITPLHLFASRERTGANLSRLLIVGGMFAMFFFVSQYTQGVLGYSPLKAGLAFLPQTLLLFGMVQIIPKLTVRVGNARVVKGGLVLTVIGMTWLSQIGDHSSYFPHIALPLMLMGIGMGSAFIPLTTLGISGVDPRDAGAASGLVNVSQQMGGSLGLGILVSVFGAGSRHAAANPVAPAGSALEASHQLAQGVGAVLTGSAIFMALALVVMVTVVRKPRQKVAHASREMEAMAELA